MCGCDPAALCDSCRDEAVARLHGVCCSRADTWLASLPPAVRRRPWPGRTAKVVAIARRKVEDLTRDPQLLDLLARELALWAEKRWSDTVR